MRNFPSKNFATVHMRHSQNALSGFSVATLLILLIRWRSLHHYIFREFLMQAWSFPEYMWWVNCNKTLLFERQWSTFDLGKWEKIGYNKKYICESVEKVRIAVFSDVQVERTWDLVRDSGQRKLTYSSQNHCTSSRSVYLSRRLYSHWERLVITHHLQKWESSRLR